MSFAALTRRVGDGLALPGWQVAGERLLADAEGGLLWIVNPPELRTWRGDVIAHTERPPWQLDTSTGTPRVLCDKGDAELDTIEMRGAVAEGFRAGGEEPLTAVPMRTALAGPAGLEPHLVGGRVLSGGPRRKWPIEQVALSLYRIARRRGGPFWDAVATHIAGATAARVEADARGRPAGDIWGRGEVHVRYLADAALLLRAQAEWTGGERFRAASAKAAAGLESFAVPLGGGRWYLHDSEEEDAARNDLVLNTHLHALTALRACGCDTRPGMTALDGVLGRTVGGPRALVVGAGLAASDAARAFGPERVARPLAEAAHERVAAFAHSRRGLRIAGGYVARDASGRRAPTYYFVVNLADLATLLRNERSAPAAAALRQGLRYASAGALRAEIRAGDPLAAVIPTMLRNAGRARAAKRAAHALRKGGFAPAIGWPGYEDALWERLAAGTP